MDQFVPQWIILGSISIYGDRILVAGNVPGIVKCWHRKIFIKRKSNIQWRNSSSRYRTLMHFLVACFFRQKFNGVVGFPKFCREGCILSVLLEIPKFKRLELAEDVFSVD